jgi:hypothetical protein
MSPDDVETGFILYTAEKPQFAASINGTEFVKYTYQHPTGGPTTINVARNAVHDIEAFVAAMTITCPEPDSYVCILCKQEFHGHSYALAAAACIKGCPNIYYSGLGFETHGSTFTIESPEMLNAKVNYCVGQRGSKFMASIGKEDESRAGETDVYSMADVTAGLYYEDQSFLAASSLAQCFVLCYAMISAYTHEAGIDSAAKGDAENKKLAELRTKSIAELATEFNFPPEYQTWVKEFGSLSGTSGLSGYPDLEKVLKDKTRINPAKVETWYKNLSAYKAKQAKKANPTGPKAKAVKTTIFNRAPGSRGTDALSSRFHTGVRTTFSDQAGRPEGEPTN